MSRYYYSGAALFKWLRKSIFKINKPTGLPLGDWDKWYKELKDNRPVAHFVTETLPDWLEVIPENTIGRIHDLRYFVINYITGSHRLNSTLKRGQYHELAERMLYSNFDSFVDFIEIEEASKHIAWSNKDDLKKYNVPWHQRIRILDWGLIRWRCPQAGIDHLKWEMTLDTPDPNDPYWTSSPHQAENARHKMELYLWWTKVRPARGNDAWEVSGMNKFWEEMEAKYGGDDDSKFGGWLGITGKGQLTPAERAEYYRLSEIRDELEEQWGDEDTNMLVRLIKIRQNLWT